MKLILKSILLFIIVLLAGCSTTGGKEESGLDKEVRDLADALETGEKKAAWVLEDFDERYAEDPLKDYWWTYIDDRGSRLNISLDGETGTGSGNSLKLDFDIKAKSGDSIGYGGAEHHFAEIQKFSESEGLVLTLKASEPGLEIFVVFYINDPTQTSSYSMGKTPFQYNFKTPPGSDEDWVDVVLPWSGFKRALWLGEEGSYEMDPDEIITFEVAFDNQSEEDLTGIVYIDQIRVIMDKSNEETSPLGELNPVKMSQIGFRPGDKKYVLTEKAASSFEVLNGEGETVYRDDLEDLGFDPDTRMNLYRGDFSGLTEAGIYRVRLPDGSSGYPFVIGGNVFDELLRLSIRSYYLQRSGMDIDDSETGIKVAKGHNTPAQLWGDPEKVFEDLSGGWYDAGDFGRYVPTAAFSVVQLMHGWEKNRSLFGDDHTDIPESGNNMPDILDEVRWELEWLLKMQDKTGVVYHKITTEKYPGHQYPADDKGQLYLFGPTSADTAMFTAAMARAASAFSDIDREFSGICLEAALKGWSWLEGNPDQFPEGGFANPPSSEYPMQGGYDLAVADEDADELEGSFRLWAAAELFRTLGEKRYEEAFQSILPIVNPDGRFRTLNWVDAYPMALYAMASSEYVPAALKTELTEIITAQADELLAVAEQSLFAVTLKGRTGPFAYIWGSNQIVSSNGVQLMMAYDLSGKEVYRDAAYNQLQYILGHNGLAKCYFQGLGTDTVKYPHHNLSMYLNRAVPGFMGEGANGAKSDGSSVDSMLRALWNSDVPPGLCYADNWNSYATNEPTIDGNASFVALLSSLMK